MSDRQEPRTPPEQRLAVPAEQAAELVAWARARALYVEEPRKEAPLRDPELAELERRLSQPLAPEQAEDMLDRALAQAVAGAPPRDNGSSGASIHSLAAARDRRRRGWIGSSLTALVVAAAATFMLVADVGPDEPAATPQKIATASGLEDLRFQLGVQAGNATIRSDSEPAEHVFADREKITLTLTPIERVRADVELRVFATRGERRIELSWETRLGDPALGDREIRGDLTDLGPGTWRLCVEAVDPRDGSVRWRGETALKIQRRGTD